MQSGMPVQNVMLHHASKYSYVSKALACTCAARHQALHFMAGTVSTSRTKASATKKLLLQVQKLSVRKVFMPVSRSEDGKAIPHGLADSAMGPTDQFGM